MLKSRGRLLMIGGVLLVVVLAGVGVFFNVRLSIPAAAAAPRHADPALPGPQYVLKERIINLADPGGRRYVKVAMCLEMGGAKEGLGDSTGEERQKKQAEFDKTLSPWVPLIDDAIISQIGARTSADLSTAEGKTRLKNDIKDSINRILGGEQVTNVYLTSFVMQ